MDGKEFEEAAQQDSQIFTETLAGALKFLYIGLFNIFESVDELPQTSLDLGLVCSPHGAERASVKTHAGCYDYFPG